MVQRTWDDREAKPLLPEQRELLAEQWLRAAGQLDGNPVDIIKVLGKVSLVSRSAEKLGDDRAQAYPHLKVIAARPDLIQRAKNGDPAAQMDIAHELGHCIINEGSAPKPLKASGNATYNWINWQQSEEALAWKLARAIMMPRDFIGDKDTAASIAERFKVPHSQAAERLAELRFERRKGLQRSIEQKKLSDIEEEAWRRAGIVEDRDPSHYRLSYGGFLVERCGCGNRHNKLGWFVYNGQIYNFEEFDPSWF